MIAWWGGCGGSTTVVAWWMAAANESVARGAMRRGGHVPYLTTHGELQVQRRHHDAVVVRVLRGHDESLSDRRGVVRQFAAVLVVVWQRWWLW